MKIWNVKEITMALFSIQHRANINEWYLSPVRLVIKLI